MKKIAKLSLVAAVAVVGLTTANAQPLEEAIKNVDVSGSVVYRYNNTGNDSNVNTNTNPDAATNNYKVGLNLSSKVNEDVKFNSRILVGGTDGGWAANGLNAQDGADANPTVTLSNAYFGYTGIQNTTVNVGKQGLTTPWTVATQIDGNEQNGTGILALTTVGPVTLAGAYFNQTNLNDASTSNSNPTIISTILDGSEDILTAGAIVAAGPVTLDAWYIDLADKFDSYTIGAKSDLDLSGVKLGVDARWASLEVDKSLNATGDKNTMAKLALTAKAGIVNGKIAYAMTGKDGGLTALDNDANTTLLGWSITSNGKADADYWQAVAGVDILSNLNLSANYGNLQYIAAANSTTDIEEEEIYAQLLYKMSKNLTTYVRYGTYTKETSAPGVATVDNNDDIRGRLQVAYTF
ncbi:MAG: major outer membrane protein [Campylobacterales bacterium]|nr:major outer membrane protein [Campylobacterales bacterium]